MKKITSIIFALLIYCPCLKAQERMTLGSNTTPGAPVVFNGTINVNAANISWDNLSITCKELVLNNTVTNIKITGRVTITCEKITIVAPGAATAINFEMKGSFKVLYSKEFDGGNREISFSGTKNEGFSITENEN